MENPPETDPSEMQGNTYRIGAVSRLTGIPTDTLRIWERRYQLIEPLRSPKGGRLYTQEHVKRLAVIKALVDRGHAIGTIAHLSGDELCNRLQPVNGDRRSTALEPLDLCVAGQALSVHAQSTTLPAGLRLTGAFPDLASFQQAQPECHTLLVEVPCVDRELLAELAQPWLTERVRQVILIYSFGPRVLLDQLRRLRVSVLRAPITVEEALQRCLSASLLRLESDYSKVETDALLTGPVPARLFSSDEMIRLSSTSSSLKCECPQHLTGIIETLLAFEQYSNRCESDSRADAALHSYLHAMTARARHIMEIALQKVVEVEQIALND